MSRIIICRHANTFDAGDVITRVGARTDLPLSKSGKAQAKKLAEALDAFNFNRAYISPLSRTQETAATILAKHNITPETVPFLTEIDYGEDENKPETEVIKRLGQDTIDAWDQYAIPPQGWQVDPVRLRQNWIDFFEKQSGYEGDILVVTSNGVARFVLDVITTQPDNISRKLKTAAYGILSITPEKWVITDWGLRA